MAPISTIVTALAMGAGSLAKGVVGAAAKDAYDRLKSLVKERYASVEVEVIERAPDSSGRRSVLAEEFKSAGADVDQELLMLAQVLIQVVHQEAPAAASAIGVSIKDVEGGNLSLHDITATGSGVELEKGRFDDITISGIRAGTTGADAAKNV